MGLIDPQEIAWSLVSSTEKLRLHETEVASLPLLDLEQNAAQCPVFILVMKRLKRLFVPRLLAL